MPLAAVRAFLRNAARLALVAVPAFSAHAYDWLQFGGNPRHSAGNTAETLVGAGNVASLVQAYQVTLPGTVDGAPVFLEAVSTPGGTKDLLFVTTRDARILALDAASGATVWSAQFGPGSCRINNGASTCYTTSSPAIDPNRQFVYSYGLDGFVHKLQVGNGGEIVGGGWPQVATLKGYDEKGSSALATATSFSNGRTYLYVTHSGYPGDNGDYQGHVTAIDLGSGTQNVFNVACSDIAQHLAHLGSGSPSCTTPRNGVWARAAVVYDAGTERILLATGNGVYDGNAGGHNWSESVVALNPDGTGGSGVNAGKPVDAYTPVNFQDLDNTDIDIGSTAPAVLPVPPASTVQHLALQSGKDGLLRLLNTADLSGQGGPGNLGGEVGAVIAVPQGGGVFSQPAVWVNPADGSTWVFVVNASGMSALQLQLDGNNQPFLQPQWQNAVGGTSPIAANGLVFVLAGSSIRARDATTGAQIWSAATGGGVHWQSLMVANGRIYATDQSNHLVAFALPSPPVALTNGGFETPNLGSGFAYGPSGSGVGWTFTPGSGIERNGSAFGAALAPEGRQAGFIQSTGTISQSLSLPAGNYTIAFKAAQRPCCLAPYAHPLTFKVDGVAVGAPLTPPNTLFSTLSQTFSVAGGGTHTLSFSSTDGNDRTAFIDSVTLAPTPRVPVAIALGSSLNPSLVDAPVLYTAQVSGGSSPSGTVAFTADGPPVAGCAAVPLSSGVATCQQSDLTVGTHGIVATYSGDSGNAPAISATLTQQVTGPLGTLQNPGFESPALGSGWSYAPTGTSVGWSFTAGSGIQGNGSIWGATAAPEGSQTAFVQSTGAISQYVLLDAGTYTLSFRAAQRPCCAPPFPHPIIVMLDGVAVGSPIAPPSTAFTSFNVPLSVATSGLHLITFTSTDGNDRTTFIDAIDLTTP